MYCSCWTVYMTKQRSKSTPHRHIQFIYSLECFQFYPVIQERVKDAEYLHLLLMCKIGLLYLNFICLNDKYWCIQPLIARWHLFSNHYFDINTSLRQHCSVVWSSIISSFFFFSSCFFCLHKSVCSKNETVEPMLYFQDLFSGRNEKETRQLRWFWHWGSATVSQ